MEIKRYFKLIFIVVIVGVFISIINAYSKDIVDYYDEMFEHNEFTLYTDQEIIDTDSLYQEAFNVSMGYRRQEYYNDYNDYSSLQLSAQNCNYDDMTCTFILERQKWYNGDFTTETLRTYENIQVTIESDIDAYFPMITNGNVVIDYDESMFDGEEEKVYYIQNYFNSMGTYENNTSVFYSYDSYSKIATRTEQNNSVVVSYMRKKVNDVVFEHVEEPYSDKFKALTSGTLVIKSDSPITRDLLSSYLTGISNSTWFTIDGDISHNKVYIKMMEYTNGMSSMTEKHLVTLVQDDNIDVNIFSKPGYTTGVNIAAEEPLANTGDYINNFFNLRQLSYTLEDGYERYEGVYDYSNTAEAIIKYIRAETNGTYSDIQFHKVPINFVGYSNTVSDNYQNTVGDEVIVNADNLSIETINMSFNYNVSALGCNDDYSYCDIALFDNETKSVEIHNVHIVLNDVVSDEFKNAFNIKEDGSIDIIMDQDVELYNYLSNSYYNEKTQDSLQFYCNNFGVGANNKCSLTLRNYKDKISETHNVSYNIIYNDPSSSYLNQVNMEVDVYPGETQNIWSRLNSSYEYFSKKDDHNVRAHNCDSSTSMCAVILINADKNLEIHNSKVNIKTGKSPKFVKNIPGDTIKLNSIYKDDENYLMRASMGYLMSKTQSWSYISDFNNGTGLVVFDNIESHTMNVTFVEANEQHKQIVDDVVAQLGNEQVKIRIEDLEFINRFYYNDATNPMTSNYNSRIVNEEFNKYINNKHISYFFAAEGGLGGPFLEALGGSVVLYYDGIAYAMTNSFIETIFNSILYIPDDTEDTTSAFIAAAQERIDDYLGSNSGVIVSYSRPLEVDEIDSYYMDITGSDGNVYLISYKDREQEFIIAKNSSKMRTSTFNASDVNNNINISSDNANYPANTVVASDIKDNSDYDGILKQMGLDNAEIVDLNLYSPTIGNITDFDDVDFDVSVPVGESLKGKKLYAYFIDEDGKLEEHPVELDDFVAKFNTDHFSTYIIAEKVKDSNIIIDAANPNTGDNIIKYVFVLIVSLLGLLGLVSINKIIKTH